MIRATPHHRPGWGSAALALAVSASILFAAPAVADRLVTRDGTVIETAGAWKVQGRLVIFELPDGQLASMQLREVDLDASRAATEQSKVVAERPPESEPPEKTAVMVLTDADVGSVASALGEPAEGTAEESEPPADTQRLVVRSWEEASDDDGVVITGELVNQSSDVAASIQLGVLLYDREGDVLETILATVTSQVLQPGERARFRAEIPGVFAFSALRFEAESIGLVVGAEGEATDDESDLGPSL